MQRVTRERIFETNSSSTHSISIVGGNYIPDILPVDNRICKVYPGEFGWEIDTFHDAAIKASYCLTYVKTGGDDEAGTKTQMLIGVLKEQTQCEVELIPNPKKNDWDYEWGYIDHQSHIGNYDVCGPAFDSKETLRDFIFNPQSYLHTDNDNHWVE